MTAQLTQQDLHINRALNALRGLQKSERKSFVRGIALLYGDEFKARLLRAEVDAARRSKLQKGY